MTPSVLLLLLLCSSPLLLAPETRVRWSGEQSDGKSAGLWATIRRGSLQSMKRPAMPWSRRRMADSSRRLPARLHPLAGTRAITPVGDAWERVVVSGFAT